MVKKNHLDSLDLNVLKIDCKKMAIEKVKHPVFARYCLWLINRHDDGVSVHYTKDLEKYAQINPSTAFTFFSRLVNLGYLVKRDELVHHVWYILKYDGDKIKLMELLPYIEETLGLDKKGAKK